MCLMLTLLIAPQLMLAKPGTSIPLPKQTVVEAVKAATGRFLDEKANSETELAWRRQFIVVAVTYETPVFRRERKAGGGQLEEKDEWSWFVTFIHPVQTDTSHTLRVMADGTVTEYTSTK
jgi:hypothetical protein